MSGENAAENGAQAQQEAGEQGQQTQQTAQNAAQGAENGAQATATQQTATQSAPAQSTQPAGNTVNAHKYQRDIARLEKERDDAKAEAEGYKGLKAEFEQWKADQEAAKAEDALKSAGCHDTKAAMARLDEFDGDIDKLKEAAPYLFTSSDTSKSTGGNPKGNPDPEDERTANLRKIMGLEDDKEK